MIKYFIKIFLKIFMLFMAIFAVYVTISYNAEIKNAELSYKNILKTYYNLVSTYKSDDFNETKSFFKSAA